MLDTTEYVGFWARVAASIIDTLWMSLILVPLLLAIYGRAYFDSTSLLSGPADFLITWVLPAVAVILFWLYKQATPGKMVIYARVVDAVTGNAMTRGQAVWRYIAYYIAGIPLCLGFIWVAFDPRKQGWHDKLAGTVVIRTRAR